MPSQPLTGFGGLRLAVASMSRYSHPSACSFAHRGRLGAVNVTELVRRLVSKRHQRSFV